MSNVSKRKFPESVHSYETLMEIADLFTIPDRFYSGNVEKLPFTDLPEEILEQYRREVTPKCQSNIEDAYAKATAFDAYFLYPRLPAFDLRRITGLLPFEMVTLKKMCNILRDKEYQMERETARQMHTSIFAAKTEDSTGEAECSVKAPQAKPVVVIKMEDLQMKVRPYLNEKMILRMPKAVQELFCEAPKHILKRMWTGKKFDKYYDEAVKKYAGA